MESAPCAEVAAARKEHSKKETIRSIGNLLEALTSESGFSGEKKTRNRNSPQVFGLCMGTFRKFLFILYSRRPKGRLLVNHEKIGITGQKILFYSSTVKKKIVFLPCT
jgi:hypothetical protein